MSLSVRQAADLIGQDYIPFYTRVRYAFERGQGPFYREDGAYRIPKVWVRAYLQRKRLHELYGPMVERYGSDRAIIDALEAKGIPRRRVHDFVTRHWCLEPERVLITPVSTAIVELNGGFDVGV